MLPVAEPQVEAPVRARGITLRTYLAVVIVLPLLALLAMFPLASSRFFMHISHRAMWHASDYRFLDHRENCDVVIFGDSTGMIGVNPLLVEARTGYKTCNLALPYMVGSATGTEVLDNYLAHNKPPRYIVLHLGPGHLHRPYLDEDNGIVDGWLEVAAHEPPLKAAWFFITHPRDSLFFAVEVWRQTFTFSSGVRPDLKQRYYRRDLAQLTADHGWFPQDSTFWDGVCNPITGTEEYDRTYLDQMVARYTRQGTQVLLWVGPARTCDKRLSSYRKGMASLHMPELMVLPPSMFSDAYHVNREGATKNTEALSQALLAADRSRPQDSARR